MREEQRRRKRISRRRCVATIAAVLLVAGGLYAVSSRIEANGQRQERGVAQSEIGQRKQVTYEGKTYAERVGMTKLLLMGVDKQGEAARNDARQGGQADFLLLVLLDHQNHQIRTLQLDRDTMTAVEVLGVLGNPVGTRKMQICLSHGYGMTEEASCENTLNAVENLLEGADIEYYVAMNMDAIGILNDALGGVTVTLEDDFTAGRPDHAAGRDADAYGGTGGDLCARAHERGRRYQQRPHGTSADVHGRGGTAAEGEALRKGKLSG